MSVTPNMSCPDGGSFYACAHGSRFVGCCASNPCGTTGCAAGNLRNTSFDPNQYGEIPDQQCDSGLFYTCTVTDPPFWGCCSTSPCGDGCSEDGLSGAFLSSNAGTAEPFLQLNGTVDDDGSDSGGSTNAGAIAGGVIGGIAGITLIVLAFLWFYRRKRRAQMQATAAAELEDQQIQELPENKQGDAHETYPSPPAPYSPQPPSYWSEADSQHVSHELPGVGLQIEMDGNHIINELETPDTAKPQSSTTDVRSGDHH